MRCSPVTPSIDRLFSLPGRGIRTFDAMRGLDALLAHPHRAFPTLHVAGTNGKGSVSTKIAAALQYAGYKTGLYTSPHIASYRERICIDRQPIPETIVEQILPEIFNAADRSGLQFSFFDLMTALAFVYFKKEKVDFAVIETGLGGRLDATNVIQPLLSVITSIGYDHTHLLGGTLQEIAREKEGIVKPGVPLIAGPKAAPFYSYAVAAPAASEEFYDFENRSIAKTALTRLQKQIPLSDAAIEKALPLRPPCRFEVRGDLILDVAHNPDAFEKLIQALEFHFSGQKFPFYMAFSADKDWKRCVEIASSRASQLFFIRGSFPRLVQPEILQAQFPDSEIVSLEGIRKGVVCGSFYIMSDFIQN